MKISNIRDIIVSKDRYIEGYIVNDDTGEVIVDIGEELTFEHIKRLSWLITNKANISYEEGFILS